MTIKDLKKVLNRAGRPVSDVERVYNLDYLVELTGRCLYVDASVFLHSTKAAYLEYNDVGEYIGHYKLIYNYYDKLVKFYNITLVWVFDPIKSPALKDRTTSERASNPNRSTIFDINIPTTMDFIKSLGMAAIRCDEIEAEHCASLYAKSEDSYVLSTDSDVICYGANLINLKLSSKTVTVLKYNDVIEHLDNISREDFIKLCCLLGTDYCRKTRGFGPSKLKVLNRYDLNDEQTIAYEYILGHDNDERCIIVYPDINFKLALSILDDVGVPETNQARRAIHIEAGIESMF